MILNGCIFRCEENDCFSVIAEDELHPTSAVVRNNPRLAVTQDEYMNSVPSRPPEAHYQPPNQAFHTSIPDFSLLRIDSDEHERSSEWDPPEGGTSEHDGLSSIERTHDDDGLSSEEYPHEDDGLSSGEGYDDGLSDTSEVDIPAMLIQNPKMNSQVVVPRWDVMPQLAEPSQEYNEIEDYSLQALGILAGATANQNVNDLGHGHVSSHVTALPVLDELHQCATSDSSSNSKDNTEGDSNMQVQSLSNSSENSIIDKETNQNVPVLRLDVPYTFSAGCNLQNSQLRQVQLSSNGILDNPDNISEQNPLPESGQGDATRNISDKSYSRTSFGGFSDIVCNNGNLSPSDEIMFPTELLNASFENLSINNAPNVVQAAGRPLDLLLPSQPLIADINENRSPENLPKLPNLPLLHEEDADSTLHVSHADNDTLSQRSTSRVSNPQQLLEDMQLGRCFYFITVLTQFA